MKAIRIKPREFPETIEIDNTLDALQKEVGGYIQMIYPFDDPVAIVCNEEGKLMNLPENRLLRDENGRVYDILVGTVLLVGLGEEDFVSLTDEYVEKYTKFFEENGPVLIF